MLITDALIDDLYGRLNTGTSKRDQTYIPPYDIQKTLEIFLLWLDENGYEISEKPDEPRG